MVGKANLKQENGKIDSKKIEKSQKNKEQVTFKNVRHGYVPSEQVSLAFVVSELCDITEGDQVVLSKSHSDKVNELTPYKWEVPCFSTSTRGTTYHIPVIIPNLQHQDQPGIYQFVYQTSKGELIGSSDAFVISNIIELSEDSVKSAGQAKDGLMIKSRRDDCSSASKRVNNAEVRDSFIKLYNVSGLDSQVTEVMACADREETLKKTMSSVSGLINQFERMQEQAELRCQRLEQQVKDKQRALQWQEKVAGITQSLGVFSEEAIAEQLTRLKRQHDDLLTYLNIVSTEAAQQGYSCIVDKEGEEQQLPAGIGNRRTLDLRSWCESSKREQKINGIKMANKQRIETLAAKSEELKTKLADINREQFNQYLSTLSKERFTEQAELKPLVKRVEYLMREMSREESKLAALVAKSKMAEKTLAEMLNQIKDLTEKISEPSDISVLLAAQLLLLKERLAKKSREVEQLSDAIEQLKSRYMPFHHCNSLSMLRSRMEKGSTRRSVRKLKAAVNTDKVNTSERSTVTEEFSDDNRKLKPDVQKAMSYTTSTSPGKQSAADDVQVKQLSVHSDQDIPGLISAEQASYIRLLQKVLTKTAETSHSPVSKSVASPENINRVLPKDATNQSEESKESLWQALCALFSEGSLSNLEREVPVTPCNSWQDIVEPKKPEQHDCLSRESLAEAMNRLFEKISSSSMQSGSSSESINLWGLLDSDPEDLTLEDARKLNRNNIKQTDAVTEEHQSRPRQRTPRFLCSKLIKAERSLAKGKRRPLYKLQCAYCGTLIKRRTNALALYGISKHISQEHPEEIPSENCC